MKKITINGRNYKIEKFSKYVKNWICDEEYYSQLIIGGFFEECDFKNCILIGVTVDDGSLYDCNTWFCKFTDDTYLKNCKNVFSMICDGIITHCKNIMCIIDKYTLIKENENG